MPSGAGTKKKKKFITGIRLVSYYTTTRHVGQTLAENVDYTKIDSIL
jgi:hypothetical protein